MLFISLSLSHVKRIINQEASEVAQWVKVLAAKPNDLSSLPAKGETYLERKETG